MNEEEIELLCLRASVTQDTIKTPVLMLFYLQVITIEKIQQLVYFSSSFTDKQGPNLLSMCVLNKDLWHKVTHNRLYSLMLNAFIGQSTSLGRSTSMAMSCSVWGCHWVAETCGWKQPKTGRDPKQDHIHHRCVCEFVCSHLIHSISSKTAELIVPQGLVLSWKV